MRKPKVNIQSMERVKLIRDSVEAIVCMLAEKEIPVRMVGSNAYVQYNSSSLEPELVNLPVLTDDASDTLLDAVQGFLDHEVGHLLYSDQLSIVEAKTRGVGTLHNILEDVFVEAKMVASFKGSQFNLNNVRHMVIDRYTKPDWEEVLATGNAKTVFQHLCTTLFRAWGGQTPAQDFLDTCDLTLIEPIIEKLNKKGIPEAVIKMETSWDALYIASVTAETVFGKKDPKREPDERLDPPKPEAPETDEEDTPPPSDMDSDDSEPTPSDSEEEAEEGEEESGDTEESGEPESGTEGDAGEEGEETDDSGLGEEDEDSDEGEREKPKDEDVVDAPFDPKDMEALKDKDASDIATELASAEHGTSSYTPFTTELDKVEPAPEFSEHGYLGKPTPGLLERVESDVADMIGPLMRTLERAFLVDNRTWWQPGKRRGRIHAGNLTRLMAGDDRIFRNREMQKTKDTAVSLVIDCSGSMYGEPIDIAAKTALALAQVLEGLGINYEVIGFTTHDEMKTEGDRDIAREMTRKIGEYDRAEPIYMPIYKAFEESLGLPQKNRLAHLAEESSYYLGQNVDGESISIAAKRLLSQPQPGKTMLVLSDGYPASCYSSRRTLNDHLTDTTAALEKQINIVGIGIMSDAPRKFYNKSVVINTLSELPTTVMGELSKAILQK